MNITGHDLIMACSAIGAGLGVAETTGLYGLLIAMLLLFVQPLG